MFISPELMESGLRATKDLLVLVFFTGFVGINTNVDYCHAAMSLNPQSNMSEALIFWMFSLVRGPKKHSVD